MRTRSQHRGPRLRQPATEMATIGIVLCLTFGAVLAGVAEAHRVGDAAWMWFFAVADVAVVVFYFKIIEDLIAWCRDVTYSDDDCCVDNEVDCLDEDRRHHHHPGEHGNP